MEEHESLSPEDVLTAAFWGPLPTPLNAQVLAQVALDALRNAGFVVIDPTDWVKLTRSSR